MSNEILVKMCHEIKEHMNECLSILEHPVESERYLSKSWKDKIFAAYKELCDE